MHKKKQQLENRGKMREKEGKMGLKGEGKGCKRGKNILRQGIICF